MESGASFAAFARKMCRLGRDGLAVGGGESRARSAARWSTTPAPTAAASATSSRVCASRGPATRKLVEAADLGLVYRGSVFTRGQFAGRTVLETELRLAPGDSAELLARAAAHDGKRLGAQPRGRNAGSMFKNPAEHPAWRLIDSVGLRGATRGDAAISDKHCNFFVNYGNARAAEVAWLVEEAERRVFETSGIRLEREVAFVGEW